MIDTSDPTPERCRDHVKRCAADDPFPLRCRYRAPLPDIAEDQRMPCLREAGHRGDHENGEWLWSDPVLTFIDGKTNTRRGTMMSKKALLIGFGPGAVDSALAGKPEPASFVRAYVEGAPEQVLVES